MKWNGKTSGSISLKKPKLFDNTENLWLARIYWFFPFSTCTDACGLYVKKCAALVVKSRLHLFSYEENRRATVLSFSLLTPSHYFSFACHWSLACIHTRLFACSLASLRTKQCHHNNSLMMQYTLAYLIDIYILVQSIVMTSAVHIAMFQLRRAAAYCR